MLFAAEAQAELKRVRPESLGFDSRRLERLDAVVDQAVRDGQVPGAVVSVGRGQAIAYARAAGLRAVDPAHEPMTLDTVFDMASLTKPIATATAVMILVDEGTIDLRDRFSRLMPEFANHGKGSITIDHLLRHRAGLIPDNPLADYAQGPAKAWENLAAITLEAEPGARFRYSDVGFEFLGKLVERKSGMSLDAFARERIFEPLGMAAAHFRPSGGTFAVPVSRIAPTEPDDHGRMLRGIVHDPRSRALGGVAGHAGLFASADDVAAFAAMILGAGTGANGTRILSPLAVRAMTDPGSTPAHERRGLGWDLDTSFSAPRGALFGPESFGHTGFTGTSVWIDPETRVFVVILTSRLHPTGKNPSPTALRARVATLAAAALVDAPPRTPGAGAQTAPAATAPAARPRPDVRSGIDVLIEQNFRPLASLKIGLITNHSGLDRDGRSTIDVLHHAPGVTLVRLFSPEHGIRGAVDAPVADSTDPATRLKITSLYGNNRKPLPADISDLDALVFDIQDIGTRFYTYITTLGLVLEAAAESGKRVFVLDRPNPIGGVAVSGPVRDPDAASFIAYHELPIRHGMTTGELALLYNAERKISARLEVIACTGWQRDMLFDDTGLAWVNPSPNIRSLNQALLYPGVGMLEATNLATGRGTDAPFERVGAPWIEPRKFAQALNTAAVPGVRFTPIHFTPSERQYKGERCGGVQISIIDRDRLDPIRLGFTLAHALITLYPKQWKPEGMMKLVASRTTCAEITAGKPVDAVLAHDRERLEQFLRIRARYLLY